MVYFSKIVGTVAAACLVGSTVAHPGEYHDSRVLKREIAARNQLASTGKRSLDACAGSLQHRELNARSVVRRAKVVQELRAKRGIVSSK